MIDPSNPEPRYGHQGARGHLRVVERGAQGRGGLEDVIVGRQVEGVDTVSASDINFLSSQLGEVNRSLQDTARQMSQLTVRLDNQHELTTRLVDKIDGFATQVATQQTEIAHLVKSVDTLSKDLRDENKRLDNLALQLHGYASSARTLSWVIGALASLATVVALFR